MNYYNEFDPHAAAWLRQLIADKLIPNGEVDERSITEVRPADLAGFTQCHFFAGIGGWSYALQLAGVPPTRRLWTGSCPCQPFSSAGKQKAQADERHLWPAFFRLIRECRPDTVIGEQVSSAIRHGWLDGISADLEGEGYAVGAVVLGAHSVGSPHIRQRLYWVADSGSRQGTERHDATGVRRRQNDAEQARLGGSVGRLADAGHRDDRGEGCGEPAGRAIAGGDRERPTWQALIGLEYAEGDGRQQRWTESGGRGVASGCRLDAADVGVGNPDIAGSQGWGQRGERAGELPAGTAGSSAGGRMGDANGRGRESQRSVGGIQEWPNAEHDGSSPWSDYVLIPCRDGKARRIESSIAPFAHGAPARVVRLRGYGNAIVPQTAAAFIEAFLETKNS